MQEALISASFSALLLAHAKSIRKAVNIMKFRERFATLLSFIPLFLMFAVFFVTATFVLSDMYVFPAYRTAISPDSPIQLPDPFSDFYLENGISPNTADKDTLCIFHGVGEKTAQAFIDERDLNGPFYFPEDILAVKGIGKKKLENIRPLMTLP